MQINLHQERIWHVVAGQAVYPTSVERVVPGAPEREIADARRLYPRRHRAIARTRPAFAAEPTMEKVKEAVGKLGNGKAVGIDNVCG